MRGVPSTCGMILSRKLGASERRFDCSQVRLLVLVAHGADSNPLRSVVQRADQCVYLCLEGRFCELLGKAPQLTATGDGRMVVEEHAVGVAALAALERDGITCPLSV
jgi:hypothetical protein